ncbi:MAG: ABC transporter ATP-binding protein [Desulfobacterales bacterium]
MLLIEELRVEVGGRPILKNINMEIPEGETHVLFGPNGSGKTTLMMTLMGFSGYHVTHGKITFKGEDITFMPIHERARLGIGISLQRPPAINGLKTRNLVEICAAGREGADVEKLAEELNFSDFLDRDVNCNFSGGEIKRSELLQLMAQQPDLVLLDEPESGVDLESIVMIGETINALLGRGIRCPVAPGSKGPAAVAKSALVITHTGHILDYITADRGRVLYDGVLCFTRNAREILKWIRQRGYEGCAKCSISI